MEDEIQLSKYLDLQVKCPSLMTDRDETYTFLGNGCRVLSMEFEGNPSNGRRDTSEKVPSSVITDCDQTYYFCSAFSQSVRHEFSGYSFQLKTR
jgi:hypothetical protein